MTRIKPCPFCGSAVACFHDSYTTGFGVVCTRNKDPACRMAIKHWNKRSIERNVKRSRIHQDQKADV